VRIVRHHRTATACVRTAILVQIALGLGACAPSGYSYGSWSDGPAAAFTLASNDDCQRPATERSLVNALNGKIGQPGGPPASVISASGLVTIENGAIDGPTLTCRGTMQTTTGTTGPGVVRLRLTDDSTAKTITVKDVSWESDGDRDRKEALERKERAARIAEAPVREAKMMDEMRASAQTEPNKTVHCGINRSHFWTTNAVCFALIEEARQLSNKIRKASRDEILHECARDVSLKLPGRDQPTYLNACEELIVAYFQ
jgi:hypothetical protein